MEVSTQPCSTQSLAANEALAGTAVELTSAWLLMELRSAWGQKAEDTESASQGLREWIASFAEGVRPQWIRQPQREGNSRAFLVLLEGVHRGIWTTEVDGLDTLLSIEPSALVSDPESCGWEPWAGPLYLVCTHGKRDRCCAVAGVPIYQALQGEVGERVWQTSHLGGHRFAANVLIFPAGYCYGRIEEDEIKGLVAATKEGRIHCLERLRGDVALPKAAQAAEVVLREWSENLLVDAFSLDAVVVDEGQSEIVFVDAEGRKHSTMVREEETGEKVAFSCGDERLRTVMRYDVAVVEESG